jgi:uncharacterized protein
MTSDPTIAGSPEKPANCWVLSSGAAGMQNQGLGLAEALQRRLPGLNIETKRVNLAQPWRALTPFLPRPALSVLDSSSDPLTAPWPDVIIGVGRQSIAPALACRVEAQRAGRALRLIQLQRPTCWSNRFDLVIPPEHDQVPPAANVEPSLGALHRVTPERLQAEAAQFSQRIAALPMPRFAVLIGGKSKNHDFPAESAEVLAERLQALAAATGGGLMVTASRRTGEANAARLRDKLDQPPHWYWDGTGDNPYFAFLAAADAIIITDDSVSMASEAAATGKPVYLFRLPGGTPKFERFHASMAARGITRPLPEQFTGPLAPYTYPPLLEADRLAGIVCQRIGWL